MSYTSQSNETTACLQAWCKLLLAYYGSVGYVSLQESELVQPLANQLMLGVSLSRSQLSPVSQNQEHETAQGGELGT